METRLVLLLLATDGGTYGVLGTAEDSPEGRATLEGLAQGDAGKTHVENALVWWRYDDGTACAAEAENTGVEGDYYILRAPSL